MNLSYLKGLTLGLSLLLLSSPARAGDQPPSPSSGPRLKARTYNSGFAQAHDTYNGMGTGSDGQIYYVLSSESIDIGAQMYCFDPKSKSIRHLGDLTEAVSYTHLTLPTSDLV